MQKKPLHYIFTRRLMPTRTSAYRRDLKDSQKLFPENLVAEVEDKSGELEDEDDGDAEGELVLLGFVVEQSHCPNCGDAAADYGEEYKHRLRHSPAVVAGFPFVETVDDECRNVDNQEIID